MTTPLNMWDLSSPIRASQVALVVKNPPAKARDAGDSHSIPGSGRPPEKDTATHCSIFAWRIPWTEKPGLPTVASLVGEHRL